MNKFKYSIILLIISIFSTSAQNNPDAERIITDLITKVRTVAIRTNFRLSVTGKNDVNSQSNSGTFTMKANKFMLVMDEMKVWFDGKTQWALMVQNNEVSVTEPTNAELADTNPMAVLSAFKSKSKIVFSKTKSGRNHVIDLIPKIKNPEFNKVEVQIDKSNGNLSSVKMFSKNGTTLLTLTNYQNGVPVNDKDFTFNKAKFKGVTINDLR